MLDLRNRETVCFEMEITRMKINLCEQKAVLSQTLLRVFGSIFTPEKCTAQLRKGSGAAVLPQSWGLCARGRRQRSRRRSSTLRGHLQDCSQSWFAPSKLKNKLLVVFCFSLLISHRQCSKKKGTRVHLYRISALEGAVSASLFRKSENKNKSVETVSVRKSWWARRCH